MYDYEIRILGSDNSTATVIETRNLNDHAAIRSARRLAGTSQFEVWRKLDCIFGEGHSSPPPDRALSRSDA
jgi:hypothetical protein